ncbi:MULTISPECIES: hypothetical protein [Chryseobacterium]|uniref:DNA-binding MarR family transcriptional regulator n=1 Tax=Chryseobacterium camelliae TaxID=1265445 RepID=A0ABU0TKM1_9FLAO|nr:MULTISPECIES: hypothetical protein [Chryseobacterium]MDT3408547.1 DNA-binding MarR family transcriptional regulator [Pseudacidovorax intermedius]MDQ1097598.1 DNA-binding MarR family transcriptional regulator [Chryseobacterium camelliae]MDQ1101527.1 DNA-binding MarR family transcriptional regulator [Chryseobacterium sp. SORGH_AS_1048]MDR6084970.1 DNA-binding MarR family transcriptional regulator [Chryseobacterium sp. SORGH_AS_0909]MDR6129323.1 DNA-binding MarR family transcriptional regulato
MNKTVELVNQWAAFEEKHPDGSIQDFFRYELIKEREKQPDNKFLGGVVPPKPDQMLAKIIDRLAKIYMLYAVDLLKTIDIGSFDEFLYLNNIYNTENPKKIDIINNNFNELSSGLLILDRLKKKNFIFEKADLNDKRSKIISLSAEGERKLKSCYELLDKVNQVIFKDMSTDDILLSIKLLKPVEIKFSGIAVSDKKVPFEEIYRRETE